MEDKSHLRVLLLQLLQLLLLRIRFKKNVRVLLLVWIQCFDLLFRVVAVVHNRLEREKQNGSPSVRSPPAGTMHTLSLLSLSADTLCVFVPLLGCCLDLCLCLEKLAGPPSVGQDRVLFGLL